MFIKKLLEDLSESFLISLEIITLKYLVFIPYGKCSLLPHPFFLGVLQDYFINTSTLKLYGGNTAERADEGAISRGEIFWGSCIVL